MLKLNPDIGFSDETIRERLQEFVFLPGVNIEFLYADSGEHVWEINAAIPFSEGRHIHQLTHAETENVIRYYNGPYTVDPLYLSPLRISMEVLSLGIGKHCDDSDINGYLYVALIYDETMLETEQDLNEYSGFAFRYNSNAVMLTKNQQILVNAAPLNIGFPGISFNQIKVYFNGVLHAATFDQGKPYYNVCGNLSLRGAHRPDAHVSRDGNAIFSLNTLSLLNHAFRSAVRSQTKQNRHFQHVYDGVRLPPRLCRLNEMPTYGAVMKADGIETLWLEERIIYTEAGVMSIGEIQKYVSDHGELQLQNIFKSKHIISVIGAYLIQKYLKIKARFQNRRMEVVAFGTKEAEDRIEALQEFPCLFFMEYEGTDHLRVEGAPYNINHPLSQTVIQLAEDVEMSDDDHLGNYLQLLLNCLKVKYTHHDMLNQNLIVPVNQVLREMERTTAITDWDFIINPEYEFDLSEELELGAV